MRAVLAVVCAASLAAGALAGASIASGARTSEPRIARLPGVPRRQLLEPARRQASGRRRLGADRGADRAGRAGAPGFRHRLQRRPEWDPGHGRVRRWAPGTGPLSVRVGVDGHYYPLPRGVAIEGGPRSTGDRHVIVVDRATCTDYELFAAYPHDHGLHWTAGSGAIFHLAPTICGRPAGPRPTPPGCRSCPDWRATARSPPERSTTRCGSRRRAPGRATSTRRATWLPAAADRRAADGLARAAEGRRRDLQPALPGARRARRRSSATG